MKEAEHAVSPGRGLPLPRHQVRVRSDSDQASATRLSRPRGPDLLRQDHGQSSQLTLYEPAKLKEAKPSKRRGPINLAGPQQRIAKNTVRCDRPTVEEIQTIQPRRIPPACCRLVELPRTGPRWTSSPNLTPPSASAATSDSLTTTSSPPQGYRPARYISRNNETRSDRSHFF
jgi:hypothetical protein